jgi:hypothetical protein
MNAVSHELKQFTFALLRGDEIVHIFLVKPASDWAVKTIEAVINNNRVSHNCELLAVHTGQSHVKSSKVDEISYVDFVLDIVNPKVLAKNYSLLDKSLTNSDRRYIVNKVKTLKSSKLRRRQSQTPYPIPPPFPIFEEEAPISLAVTLKESINRQRVISALTDLGFKRPQVKEVVSLMGSKLDNMKLEDSIREALQLLVKA